MIFNTEHEMSEVFETFVKANLEDDNVQIFNVVQHTENYFVPDLF